jgi:hypothetical protein
MLDYKQNFDVHMVVTAKQSGIYNAKCIFGNNAILFDYNGVDPLDAIRGLNQLLETGLVYQSLVRDSSLSVWPIPNSTHNPTLSQSGGQSAVPSASTHVFDFHVQCGSVIESTNGDILGTYAYTESDVLVPTSHQTHGNKDDHWDAIDNLLNLLMQGTVFNSYCAFPGSSKFPFSGKPFPAKLWGSSTAPPTWPHSPPMPTPASRPPVPAEVQKKQLKRRLPSDIIDVVHPACQDVCTSWDIFGKSKCGNMCEWRKEV